MKKLLEDKVFIDEYLPAAVIAAPLVILFAAILYVLL